MSKNIEKIIEHLQQDLRKDELFKEARRVRDEIFNGQVFAYGFDYFSTYCVNECAFCHYRKSNDLAKRYRNTEDEIVDTAKKLADSGVHLIDITMGEDAYYKLHPEKLAQIVSKVKEETDLPIMVSPGIISEDTLEDLRNAGATWFALYQETYSRSLYEKMRVGQSFDKRIKLKEKARKLGYLIEEGIMTGFGDSIKDAAYSIAHMGDVRPSQVRTMTFIPQPGTPMQDFAPTNRERELKMIAAMRLAYPNCLIPASLDVEGASGLEDRLNAGANVITSIIPPDLGLAGVSRSVDIDDGGRTLSQIMPIIHKANLELASQEEYNRFIENSR